MKYLYLIFFITTTLFFSACASKEVFEPENVNDDWEYYGSSDFTIENIAPNVALVDDRQVIVNGEVIENIIIAEDESLLGSSDGWIISATIDGNLTLRSMDNSKTLEHFDLKRTVATASVKDDTLAILFTNNKMALYSISSKELLLKEQGDAPIVVNSKVVAPYFKDNLVIFSTLDGKVVLIDISKRKKLRTVIVSSEEYFNNVIYFNFVDNKIIASTPNKVLSLAKKEIRVKYDIRNVVDDGKNIYLSTKQGEIVSLTPDLQLNKKVKFPFAHFLGMIMGKNSLYVLEKEGYIIELSKDLLEYKIYEADVEDGYIFIDGKVFYIDDEYILVE